MDPSGDNEKTKCHNCHERTESIKEQKLQNVPRVRVHASLEWPTLQSHTTPASKAIYLT